MLFLSNSLFRFGISAFVDYVSVADGEGHAAVENIIGGNVEEIAVPDDDVRELAALEAAENIFLADLVCAAVGVGVERVPQSELLLGVPAVFGLAVRILAGDGL